MMGWNVECVFNVCLVIGYVAYVAPYFLLIVPVTLVIYYQIAKDYMRLSVEANTLASKMGYAAIATHINESIDGKFSILGMNKIFCNFSISYKNQ